MRSAAAAAATVALSLLLVGTAEAFTFTATHDALHAPSRPGTIVALASTTPTTPDENEDEDEPQLIVGTDAVSNELETLEAKLTGLGSEAGYLAAAAERKNAARAKMLEEAAAEEAQAQQEEAYLANKGEWRRAENYGPGDLSGAAGGGGEILMATDDGWEKSLGADEDNVIGAQVAIEGEMGGSEAASEEEEAPPSLFIPGGDDGDGPILF